MIEFRYKWAAISSLNFTSSAKTINMTSGTGLEPATMGLWVRVQSKSLKLQILRLLRARVPWHSGNLTFQSLNSL